MGTRSRIGYVNPDDGKITSAYCHWDGYPSHNGKILLENYTTLEAVKTLVDQGDMSSLNAKCDKPEGHTFDTPVEGYTIYYGRDRGERSVSATTVKNEKAFIQATDDSGGEYAYLFNNGKWFYTSLYGENKPLKRLTKAACNKDS